MSFECSELKSFFVAKLSDYIGVKHDHSRVFVGLSHQNQPDAPWFDVCFVRAGPGNSDSSLSGFSA